jgi:hypothetical protein
MGQARKQACAAIAEGASGAFGAVAGAREDGRFWVFFAGSSVHTCLRSEQFHGFGNFPSFFAQVKRHQGV